MTVHAASDLIRGLFAENSNLKDYEPLMQRDPVPTLAGFTPSGALVLDLKDPLDQISLTIPYSVSLFNKGYFWETHEVLEDLWMDEVGPTKTYLQGFIQAAAALYHVVAQNPSGYERLSRLSREKLQNTKFPNLGVDLSSCLWAFAEYDRCVVSGDRFDLNQLPKITFAGIKL